MRISIKPEEDSNPIHINTGRVLYVTEPNLVSLRFDWIARALLGFKNEDYWVFRIEFGNDSIEVRRSNRHDLVITYESVLEVL